MTRLHFVKKARKNYKDEGIKKGESYFWWKFRYSSKQKQKTRPRQSQLTQSEFLGAIYDINDRLSGISNSDIETVREERDSIVSELQDLATEQEDKQSNMPDSLQYSPIGEMLEERANYCNEFADELDGIDLDLEKEEDESDEDFENRVEEAISELQSCEYQGE